MLKPPLPNFYGPRLPYFNAGENREPSIELLEKIGSGLHGHVVKAKIDGQTYAVKIVSFSRQQCSLVLHHAAYSDFQEQFKFTDEMNFFIKRGKDEDIAPPDSQIEAQCHPFNRECRAYARLKEVGKEHLAVKCYGYLLFDKSMEQALADQLQITDWGREPEYYPEWDKQPLHAIVKDFLPPVDFSRRDALKMRQNLKDIHQCGIIVNDVKYDAYVGRLLVDFSFAVTTPHIQFDQRFSFNSSDPVTPYQDFGHLERVFQHWNYLHASERKIKACDDCYMELEYNLRSRKEPYEPRDFDWKAYANQWTKLPRKKRWRRAAADYGQRKKKKPKRSAPPPGIGSEAEYEDPEIVYDPTEWPLEQWNPPEISPVETETSPAELEFLPEETTLDNIGQEYTVNYDSE